jgi:hypothetical protein
VTAPPRPGARSRSRLTSHSLRAGAITARPSAA